MIVPVDIIGVISPVMVVLVGVLMVVLRAGASRVYFDVIGTFQAARMLQDAQAMSTTMNSLMLDAFSGLEEAAQVLGEPIAQMVDELIPVTREVAEARIEFEKFVTEGENVNAIVHEVTELGHAFGFAADESLQAAARMAQLGGILGAGMVGTGTEVGIKFGLISGMETEAAMQRMINLQQQTDFMTQGLEDNLTMEERAQKIRMNSMNVLDQLNTVENRSAATMEQVTFVMNQFASQAHLTGESIAFMAAMSATLIEAGEEQGKGGRALRMIYARLGANTSGAADELHRLGVATHDAEGELRPLSDILRDLNAALEGQGAAALQATTQIVAGNRHYVRMIKLLENFERVEQLALEAMLAMSPAQEEVNRRLEENIIAFDIAEAKVHDYKAALGEELLPSLTAVKERQADFVMAMGELATGSPKLVGGLVVLASTFRNILGPMMQMTISMMQLNVASQTYRVLQRAIAGDELVRKDFLGRLNQDQERATDIMIEQQARAEALSMAKSQLNAEERQAVMLAGQLSQEALEVLHIEMMRNVQKGISLRADMNARTKSINGYIEEKMALQSLGEEERLSMLRQIHINDKLAAGKELRSAQITAGLEIKAIRADEAKQLEMLEQHYDALIAQEMEDIDVLEEMIALRRQNVSILKEELALGYADEMADGIGKKLEKDREEKAMMDENMKKMQARTQLMNKFSVATMGGAAAATLFIKGEKGARTAMVLTTMSMLPHIASMMASTIQKVKESGATTVLAMTQEMLSLANIKATITTHGLAHAARLATASLIAMVVASGGMLLIGVALSALAVKLGIFNTKFNQTNEMLANSPLMDAKNIVANFEMDIESLGDAYEHTSTQIEKYTQAIEEGKERGDNVTELESELQALQQIGAEQEAAIRLKEQEAILNRAGEEDIRAAFNLEEGRLKQYRRGLTIQNALNSAYAGYVKMTDEAVSALGFYHSQEGQYIHNTLLPLLSELEEAGIGSAAAFDIALNKLQGIRASQAEASVGAITDELRDAEQAMYDFDNAREELFFGFASSNLTGDLVKQVVNKGVETLITNTEVIMTNNFNGMTTDEVANEILAQIERKAGSTSGISFS